MCFRETEPVGLFLQEWEECQEEVSRAQRDLEMQWKVNELKLQAISGSQQGMFSEDQVVEAVVRSHALLDTEYHLKGLKACFEKLTEQKQLAEEQAVAEQNPFEQALAEEQALADKKCLAEEQAVAEQKHLVDEQALVDKKHLVEE